MKVVMVCAPSLGGSGIVASNLAIALANRGHEVSLVSTEVPIRLRHQRLPEGLRVVVARPPAHPVYGEGPAALALATTIAQHAAHADVIHAHYAVPHGVAAYLAAQMTGRPVVLTLHGSDVTGVGADPSIAPVVDFATSQAAVVTAVSRWLADRARARAPHLECRVVPNFLPEPTRVPRIQPAELVHASNFRDVKRPLDAVRILDLVRREGLDVPLRLYGDGPMRAECETLANSLAIADHTHFLGTTATSPELGEGQVVLIPSEQESFSLVALEAAAAGVPVVGARVGGMVELVEGGKLAPAGFLHEVGDLSAMAQSTVRLLRDRALYRQTSRAGRLRAASYSEQAAVAAYLQAYQDAVRATRPLPARVTTGCRERH